MDLRPKVRNVLGETVDDLLAKRLGQQPQPVAAYLVPELIGKPPRRETQRLAREFGNKINNRTGSYGYVAARNERPTRSSAPWEHMLLPVSYRRLKNLGNPNSNVLREIRYARAWMSGLIAFRREDFWTPDLQRYVGRMSNSSFCFVRTIPQRMVRHFVGACFQNKIRYINIFGSVRREQLSSDPLLQIAAQCHKRVKRIKVELQQPSEEDINSLMFPFTQYSLRALGQLCAFLSSTTDSLD